MKDRKIPDKRKVILLIETSREYGRGLLQGIIKYARIAGSWQFYTVTGDAYKPMPVQLKKWGADGIIMREPKNYKEIIAMNLPTITSSPTKEPSLSLPLIKVNNPEVGAVAARHLITRGFRHFAFYGTNVFWSRERAKSFGKAIAKAGFQGGFIPNV